MLYYYSEASAHTRVRPVCASGVREFNNVCTNTMLGDNSKFVYCLEFVQNHVYPACTQSQMLVRHA